MKYILLISSLSFFSLLSQQNLTIAFYNVENLFDTLDNPQIADNDFLPKSTKKWTNFRYRRKLQNIGKALLHSSGNTPPDLIGLCEVENKKVLEDLLLFSPLKFYNYSIVHKDSRDKRGIDCALLFKRDNIKLIQKQFIEPPSNLKSRDILRTKLLFKNDTLNLSVHHWPSRYGGKSITNQKRISVVQNYLNFLDSIQETDDIVIGDFNDEKTDASLAYLLKKLNLTSSPMESKGSLKYQNSWFHFDHVFYDENRFHLKDNDEKIIELNGLLIEDEKYGGKKLYRTFIGPRYIGGFSDHLPIYSKLYLN